MATLSFPLEEKFTLIGKIGYARYSVESKIEIDLAEDDLFYYYDRDLSFKEQGNDPIVSVGMLFPLRGKNSFEFSIAKIFGDAGSLSVNGIWRYQF